MLLARYHCLGGRFKRENCGPRVRRRGTRPAGTPPRDLHAGPAITFETPGIQYLTLSREGERFVSNPVQAFEDEPDYRLYWGDIRLYSQYSDGAGTMTSGYEKLWRRLRGFQDDHDSDVLTIPHHTAERIYPFDFSAMEYDDWMARAGPVWVDEP